MSGMVGVLNAHSVHGFSAGTHTACRCDRQWVPSAEYRAHVAEELTKAGFGNVREAKRDALLELAESPEALERARKRIEDELVEWRDAGRFMLRNNGLMIRNRDSTGSEIIRFGFEDGLRIALEAEAQFIAALNDPEGHALVQAIHDRKAQGECGP